MKKNQTVADLPMTRCQYGVGISTFREDIIYIPVFWLGFSDVPRNVTLEKVFCKYFIFTRMPVLGGVQFRSALFYLFLEASSHWYLVIVYITKVIVI